MGGKRTQRKLHPWFQKDGVARQLVPEQRKLPSTTAPTKQVTSMVSERWRREAAGS